MTSKDSFLYCCLENHFFVRVVQMCHLGIYFIINSKISINLLNHLNELFQSLSLNILFASEIVLSHTNNGRFFSFRQNRCLNFKIKLTNTRTVYKNCSISSIWLTETVGFKVFHTWTNICVH